MQTFEGVGGHKRQLCDPNHVAHDVKSSVCPEDAVAAESATPTMEDYTADNAALAVGVVISVGEYG